MRLPTPLPGLVLPGLIICSGQVTGRAESPCCQAKRGECTQGPVHNSAKGSERSPHPGTPSPGAPRAHSPAWLNPQSLYLTNCVTQKIRESQAQLQTSRDGLQLCTKDRLKCKGWGEEDGGCCRDPDTWHHPQTAPGTAPCLPASPTRAGLRPWMCQAGSLGAMGDSRDHSRAPGKLGAPSSHPDPQYPARALQPHFAFCNHASGVVTAAYCSHPGEMSCPAPSPPPYPAPGAQTQARDLPTYTSASLKSF